MKPGPGKLIRGLLLLLALLPHSLQAGVELKAGSTLYRGIASEDGKVQAFLGIPFAQPPTGERRWQAPLAPAPVEGTVNADSFAPACAQGPHMVKWYQGVVSSFGGDPGGFPVPRFSEDCLYLNIWTPRTSARTALPVMVYIHGGSNKGGWSYEPNYLGEQLARRDVVVVTIAYRLGLLGFFSHPELEHSNFGLLDQIAALRWLQDQVAFFGGDPSNITVMGESSGANNIAHLLVSPMARGLFRRVVHQSAGWAYTGQDSRAEHLERGIALEKLLAGSGSGLETLRSIPAESLLSAAEPVFEGHGFDPIIDGHSLLEPVADSLAAGRMQAVDLLIGSNTDEWLMYLDGKQTVEAWMRENLRPEQYPGVEASLPRTLEESRRLDRLITASNYVCPSMAIAQWVTQHGGRSWFYYFSRQREGERAKAMGAYHGAELPYVFATHDNWLPTSKIDRRLSDTMMDYWANFARSGDSNGSGLPTWSLFERKKGIVQRLDDPVESIVHPSLPLCDLL